MSLEHFTIGENRTRPPYQVKTSRCVTCDAPISLYSEKSQLVTCEYCGEKLDCSQEELKALGKDNDENPGNFRFQLHQECTWEAVKYKVIARIRSADKWDGVITEYLLFHPFQGTKWISIYDGEDELEFSISEPSHTLPRENAFSLSEGKTLVTEDGEKWRWEEENKIYITYVDGALPWLAKIGDSHSEIELVNLKNKKRSLCVEKSSSSEGSSELEYSVFKTVSNSVIYRAFGEESSTPKKSTSKKEIPKAFRIIMQLLSIAATIFFFFSCFISDKERIATFNFTPSEVSTEILSPTFEVEQADTHKAFELEYIAGVDNSWLSLNIGVVSSPESAEKKQVYTEVLRKEEGLPTEQQTKLRHLADVDISYYHGYSGGESWSEGSTSESQLLMFPEGGKYRIFLSGVSGYAETALAKNSIPLTVNVYKNANTIRYYILMAVFSLLTFFAFKESK